MIYLLASNQLLAQENNAKYTYSYGAEILSGFIIKHHDVIGNLIRGHPSGFRLNFNRYSYGDKAWEQYYGYPTFSASISYFDLKNDEVLGKIIAVNIGLGFHLNNYKESKNDIQAYMGMGIAYFTNPYDPETNNKNTVISSPLPMNVNLRLGFYRQITARINLGLAVELSHFSNGSSSVPNYGLNVVTLNLGGKYQFNSDLPEFKMDKMDDKNFINKSYINLDFRMGKVELFPVGSGASPYYAISLFWNKRVNIKSIVDAGVEIFINKAYEKEIQNNQSIVAGNPDYKSVGIMIGHELILNRLALITQLGVYVYKPYQPENWLYSKIGLKYYFTDRIFASYILKSHFAVAEVLEFGLGYRL